MISRSTHGGKLPAAACFFLFGGGGGNTASSHFPLLLQMEDVLKYLFSPFQPTNWLLALSTVFSPLTKIPCFQTPVSTKFHSFLLTQLLWFVWRVPPWLRVVGPLKDWLSQTHIYVEIDPASFDRVHTLSPHTMEVGVFVKTSRVV